MDSRDDSYEVLAAATFVAGLVLLPAALLTPPATIDEWIIQPVRTVLHSLGLAAAEAEPGLMPLMRRTSYVRMPVLFVGALCVLCNLYLFRNDRRRGYWPEGRER